MYQPRGQKRQNRTDTDNQQDRFCQDSSFSVDHALTRPTQIDMDVAGLRYEVAMN